MLRLIKIVNQIDFTFLKMIPKILTDALMDLDFIKRTISINVTLVCGVLVN